MFNILYWDKFRIPREMSFFTFTMAAYAVDRLIEDGCEPTVIFGDRDYYTVDNGTITKVGH